MATAAQIAAFDLQAPDLKVKAADVRDSFLDFAYDTLAISSIASDKRDTAVALYAAHLIVKSRQTSLTSSPGSVSSVSVPSSRSVKTIDPTEGLPADWSQTVYGLRLISLLQAEYDLTGFHFSL